MSDSTVVIYRKSTPAGRTTYWTTHPDVRGLVRVNADEAIHLVEIGRARWAEA